MIQTEQLRKHYRMGEELVRALDGVDLRIEDGESVAVLGPSGSGKSTLLHLLGGLDTPTAGRIVVDGEELALLGRRQLARYRNEKVGFVFQSFYLQPHLTALENVELPLKLRGLARRERRALAAARLEEVGLGDRMHHRPGELSGGQRQRVSIARALAGEPRFLLADEPTGNLDSRTGAAILELFMRLHRERGLTVITVTHDAAVAARHARRIELLDGRVVRDSPQ
ncbi:MAG: putative ABC transporter ATP-binding protein [Planctomycetota bacterium]|nr:MAG: putative ABC transporter ATP-binding protein [Planctomycetota bacterium]